MNEQSASGVTPASNGTTFQPSTQNPQSNVNSTLQTTGSGLQSAGGDVLGAQTNILVPTSHGDITIAPTGTPNTAAAATTAKHPPALAWVGVGVVLVMVAVLAIGILRPRKY